MQTYLTTFHLSSLSNPAYAYAWIKAENYDQALAEAHSVRDEHRPACIVDTILHTDDTGRIDQRADERHIAAFGLGTYLGTFTADDAGKIEIVVSIPGGVSLDSERDVLRHLLTRHGYTVHLLEKK